MSEGQFIALIKEAASLGVLENVSFSGDTEAYEFEIEELQARIEELKTELREKTTVIEPKTPHSEEYELKERAMETILKLVSIDELSKLSKD